MRRKKRSAAPSGHAPTVTSADALLAYVNIIMGAQHGDRKEDQHGHDHPGAGASALEAREPVPPADPFASVWGRVVINETGYRAEFAYPRCIWIATDDERTLTRCAFAYGVPVLSMSHDDMLDWALIAAHGDVS